MLRLLQGDVGSGKTAVAAWALAAAALSGRQAALLAPTDLLARQHHRTLADLLADLGLPVELLVGSRAAADARAVRGRLASGEAPIVVGTHALMSESVAFASLGLVVVDEQHRFGVEQRAALEAKAAGGAPHVLLMTATPIPRTLGQVVYADLDVTDLRIGPEGRTPITTGIRHPSELDGTWAKVRAEAAAGRRSFVVVPLIGEGDDAQEDASGVEAEAARLASALAPLRVGMVHGRLRAVDRDAEMTRFRDGDLDVLVGTTVVEVGVDVPEATLMIVEGADRFGLAQLHQLRGRVGRGLHPGLCLLFGEPPTEEGARRLEALAQTSDGFRLAELDLEIRGEGSILGLRQAGPTDLRFARLARDRRELAQARHVARRALGQDPRLGRPEHALLRDAVLQRFESLPRLLDA
jgi:ATP-dependent DNA helicase RecG